MMYKVACGVPKNKCCGSSIAVTNGLGKYMPLHSSNKEAFDCYCKYLISQGYKKIRPREFINGDGPIILLTKPSRFGSKLRRGKNEVTGKSNRFTPKDKKRAASGLII